MTKIVIITAVYVTSFVYNWMYVRKVKSETEIGLSCFLGVVMPVVNTGIMLYLIYKEIINKKRKKLSFRWFFLLKNKIKIIWIINFLIVSLLHEYQNK